MSRWILRIYTHESGAICRKQRNAVGGIVTRPRFIFNADRKQSFFGVSTGSSNIFLILNVSIIGCRIFRPEHDGRRPTCIVVLQDERTGCYTSSRSDGFVNAHLATYIDFKSGTGRRCAEHGSSGHIKVLVKRNFSNQCRQSSKNGCAAHIEGILGGYVFIDCDRVAART